MNILSFLSGYKTYIGAFGLAGLAVYQASQGDLPGAGHSAMQALALAGLRHAVSKGA